MLHQPIELDIPSAAAARRRQRGRRTIAADSARQEATAQTAVLIEAIDEAFATLPCLSQDQTHADTVAKDSTTDLGRHTDMLAGLLSGQLRELDEQRIRLADLLSQIDSRALGDERVVSTKPR